MSARKRWDEILDRVPTDRPIAGVEVGVWCGELSEHLLRGRPNLTLHMVDKWTRESMGKRLAGLCPPPTAKQVAINRTAAFAPRGVVHHGDASAIARGFVDASLDFVFIDAKHSYNAVKRDLAAWVRKVKFGGWIGGHDWCERFAGVEQAVTERFGTGPVELGEDFCWFVRL